MFANNQLFPLAKTFSIDIDPFSSSSSRASSVHSAHTSDSHNNKPQVQIFDPFESFSFNQNTNLKVNEATFNDPFFVFDSIENKKRMSETAENLQTPNEQETSSLKNLEFESNFNDLQINANSSESTNNQEDPEVVETNYDDFKLDETTFEENEPTTKDSRSNSDGSVNNLNNELQTIDEHKEEVEENVENEDEDFGQAFNNYSSIEIKPVDDLVLNAEDDEDVNEFINQIKNERIDLTAGRSISDFESTEAYRASINDQDEVEESKEKSKLSVNVEDDNPRPNPFKRENMVNKKILFYLNFSSVMYAIRRVVWSF